MRVENKVGGVAGAINVSYIVIGSGGMEGSGVQ